jgi:serine/threonine protein kinase
MSITKKRKYSMSGGIPIYPGGFSCVFKPQLKCKSKNKIRKNNTRRNKYDKMGISKLLFKQHARMEMDNIHLFYNALKSIPKSHKYFLFTKSKLCSPAKISKRDLEGFDNMCTSFTNNEINESNINANIDSLRLINMPNAGVSVNEWLFDTRLTSARIILFNKIMSELIVNAIVPMNKMGVIHNDIKEDNILISLSKTNPKPTIIDWGISGISTSHNPIPEVIMNRYISISNPFSSIIFTSDFMMSYSEFLQTHNNPSSPSFQQELSSFALSQYLKFKEIGHYSYVERFFIAAYTFKKKYMDPNPNVDEEAYEAQIIEDTYHKYASAYITDVLFHFTEFHQQAGTGTGK